MLTRAASFEQIEESWQYLLPLGALDIVFMTPQWQRIWWAEFGTDAEMLLLCLPGQEGLNAIAPLMRRNGRITFIGDEDLFDYNDFLVSPGSEERFYTALLDHLREDTWESLELFPLAAESPTLNFVPSMAEGQGYTVEIHQEDVCPGLKLPSTWDNYVEGLSRKDRHELRRKLRRLTSAGEYRWYCCSESAEVAAKVDDFLSLVRLSREDKDRFLTPQRERFFRTVIAATAAMGVVKLFFMELGGQPVASALCFDHGSCRMLYNSGFNPEYSYYSVGLLLKALCVKDAIEEGREYFDFLRGNEAYKYDLGGQDRALYRMVVKRS